MITLGRLAGGLFFGCMCVGVFSTPLVIAAPTSFQIDGAKFSIDLAEGWTAEPNFLNTPLMLLGPYDGARRPVVIVGPTTLPAKPADLAHFKNINGKVNALHQKWMDDRANEILETFKGTMLKGRASTFFTSGRKYVTGLAVGEPEIFEQRAYHGSCGDQYFFLSSVVHDSQTQAYSKPVQDMILSLRCSRE